MNLIDIYYFFYLLFIEISIILILHRGDIMNRIKELRKKYKMSQTELSQQLGIVQSTLSTWENNQFEPDSKALIAMSEIFNVSVDYLLGKEKKTPDFSEVSNIIKFEKFKKIPILGTIACGEPILAEENIEGYTNIEEDIHADFALRCKGDSMSPKFEDGDIVLIRQQPIVENGQIAAVLIGTEATLKHVYLSDYDIMLIADNPQYKPLVYAGEDMNNIRILGLAVGYIRIF